ncbi:MAG: arginine--tRNA ligase [Planctomycetes bacterium]|nr:arginine--tRNA ligase [Planctomycetota bacterium]
MQTFLDAIRAALARATGLAEADVKLEAPRDPSLGDVAFPCFQAARSLKQAPAALAAELSSALARDLPEIRAAAAGPYLNFTIERGALAREVLGLVAEQGARYGGSQQGAGKTIVIDFSSPNIAKPMHVGHLRSTILGAALARLFTALGYRVVGINHVGDWGSQFGGLVVALRRWRSEVDLERDPVRGLLELYQRSKQAVDADPTFAAEARAAWQELESGREGEVRATWRWATEASLRGFERTYARLGIRHELVRGESFYEPFLEGAIQRCQEAGIAEVSEGALVVQLGAADKGLAETPCLLRQSDGTTLYATRDLAALFHRYEEFRFERALYVVGAEQKLHFRQLKAVLKRLGLPWEARVEHVDFGLLLGRDRKKLASRKGEVLVLDDLLDEVVEAALAIIREKNAGLAHPESVAEAVGIGAIVFNDLKRERIKDVLFDREEILSFEGETGPYLQYTHARLASIERKAREAGEGGAEPDWSRLADAGPVLTRLGRYPDVVRAAAEHAEPSLLATALLALGRDLNAWYVQARVLGQEPAVTAARLALVRASKTVIGNGLRLLGCAAPDEM